VGRERESCLADREILSYLDGELEESRRIEVDRHLDECRLCAAALDGVAGLEWRNGFLRSADSIRAQVRTRTAAASAAMMPGSAGQLRPTHRMRPAPLYLTLAATLVVGLGTAILLTRSGSGEALFQEHFEPYPSREPALRGRASGDPDSPMSLYEAGDYRGALAGLEARIRQDQDEPQSRFFAGVSRLALGQTREAIVDLERVLLLADKDLAEPAAWYLALAHLRGSKPAAARPHLERIAAGGGFYRDKARALLLELDKAQSRR
jgi:tetratricopeptide (TPR) repeat protein